MAKFGITDPIMGGGTPEIDRASIEQLARMEEERKRKVLEEQKGIQSKRLTDLAALLAEQQKTEFNRDIPQIANTAQGQGFLETSGFGNALSRDYTNLTKDTSMELAKQGLADRNFEVGAIGDISEGTGGYNQSALARKFSVLDTDKANNLAFELGKMGVSAPAVYHGPSDAEKFAAVAGGVGSIAQGIGATK